MRQLTLDMQLSWEKVIQYPCWTTQGPLHTINKGTITHHGFILISWHIQEPPACTYKEMAYVHKCDHQRPSHLYFARHQGNSQLHIERRGQMPRPQSNQGRRHYEGSKFTRQVNSRHYIVCTWRSRRGMESSISPSCHGWLQNDPWHRIFRSSPCLLTANHELPKHYQQ